VQRLKSLKDVGYQIEIIYLRVDSANLALQRVAARVKQGGHDVPARDVRRRFDRSWDNFVTVYKPLADKWAVYDSSADTPQLVEKG
jgi:predicted ABC-type ATPase